MLIVCTNVTNPVNTANCGRTSVVGLSRRDDADSLRDDRVKAFGAHVVQWIPRTTQTSSGALSPPTSFRQPEGYRLIFCVCVVCLKFSVSPDVFFQKQPGAQMTSRRSEAPQGELAVSAVGGALKVE